jgi:hypothetical protein
MVMIANIPELLIARRVPVRRLRGIIFRGANPFIEEIPHNYYFMNGMSGVAHADSAYETLEQVPATVGQPAVWIAAGGLILTAVVPHVYIAHENPSDSIGFGSHICLLILQCASTGDDYAVLSRSKQASA